MNPNPDPFENDLRALQRRALPAEWRDAMLQAAAQPPRAARTPRWLVAGWSLAWAATLVMYFTTPAEPAAPQAAGMSGIASPLLWQQRAAAIEALLAAN
jgi:hypothetical protein